MSYRTRATLLYLTIGARGIYPCADHQDHSFDWLDYFVCETTSGLDEGCIFHYVLRLSLFHLGTFNILVETESTAAEIKWRFIRQCIRLNCVP